jgi:hypothetical protein
MDPKKPDDAGERRPSPARERADALTSPKPEPGQASQRLQEKRRAEASGKPVLTEKQRIEARRRRRTQRKRRPAVTGNAISRGVRATGFEVRRTLVFLGRSVLSGLDALRPVGEIVTEALRRLLGALGTGLVRLAGVIAALLAATGRLVLAADRVITPRRAFTLVAAVAAALLVVSQFMDFRAIEIGQPGYVDVRDVTAAPQTDVKSPVDTHSYVLVLAGIIGFVAAALTAVSPRRVLPGALVLAGAATLAVGLAVDLPAGLDAEDAELSYAGVKAVLLDGFWLELAAGAVLLVSGAALALQPAGERAPVRRARPARATVARSGA